ncbi:hypothetical protein EDB19DRAFT_1646875 [Suillus lakei]|nr:hypothetical protein EDB19DRAFT_1646875 [Suillus lakei]
MIIDHGIMIDNLVYEPAPGDEGLDLSHKGGEYEAFEGLSHTMADLSGFHYVDSRTRHDCVELHTNEWDMQMDWLVDAYLDYWFRDSGDGMPLLVPVGPDNIPPLNDFCPGLSNIELVDTFCMCLLFLPYHKYPNETLIYNGFLGCSPLYPNVAIALHTLAAYQQAH